MLDAKLRNTMQGLRAVYDSLDTHQLAIFHGVTREHAEEIKRKKMTQIPQEWVYRYVWVKGGFRSGKTFASMFRQLSAAVSYSGYFGMVVRKHHAEMKNTYLRDLLKLIDRVTEDQPELLILDRKDDDGQVNLTIRSTGKPSNLVFRIEPDGDDNVIAKSFKGLDLSSFDLEEVDQLKETTVKMFMNRLSDPNVPVRGTMIMNPGYAGAWYSRRFTQYMTELGLGQRPNVLPLVCGTEENTHLRKDYIDDLKEQYKDDPVGYDMAILGLDGVEAKGVPVYRGFYKPAIHRDPSIRFNYELSLDRAWDFGRNASCGFYQRTKTGRAYKIAELVVEECSAESFADQVAEFTATHFPATPSGIEDYGDYAGYQEKDTGSSVRVINKRLGIRIKARPMGNIDPGINHVRKLLSELREGKPRYSIHPRCELTDTAYRHGYHFKVYRDGRVAPKPSKDDPEGWDHIMDTDRYYLCNVFPYVGDALNVAASGPIVAKSLVDMRRQKTHDSLEHWLKEDQSKPAPGLTARGAVKPL